MQNHNDLVAWGMDAWTIERRSALELNPNEQFGEKFSTYREDVARMDHCWCHLVMVVDCKKIRLEDNFILFSFYQTYSP